MYKLARWLYTLGGRNEYVKFKAELLLYFSWQPERRVDHEAGLKESDEHYKRRIDAWFLARKMIDDYFTEKEGANR